MEKTGILFTVPFLVTSHKQYPSCPQQLHLSLAGGVIKSGGLSHFTELLTQFSWVSHMYIGITCMVKLLLDFHLLIFFTGVSQQESWKGRGKIFLPHRSKTWKWVQIFHQLSKEKRLPSTGWGWQHQQKPKSFSSVSFKWWYPNSQSYANRTSTMDKLAGSIKWGLRQLSQL